MEVPLGDTFYFKFSTRSFSTGAPTTLAGTPAISVYEENNLVQITTGVTLTVDYDGVTGMHQVAIVATSGNNYAVGKYYNAVITTGTVGGVSVVGECVGPCFRVMPAEDAGAGIKDVNVTHAADTAWASGAITAASIAADAIGASELAADAATEIAAAVWDRDATSSQTAGTFGEALGDPAASGNSVRDLIATAQADLDTITGTDGVTLATAQALYAPAKAGDAMDLVANAVDSTSVAADAITAAKIADGAIDRATFAADTGLQSLRSSTAQAGAAGSITLDASASATTDYYKGALIVTTGGTGAGQARLCTAYNGTTKVASIEPNWATNPDVTTTFAVVPMGTVNLLAATQTSIDNIEADTNEVQTDLADGGRLDLLVDAILDDTGTSGVKVATGGIASTAFATDAIDAAAINTDVITEILTTQMTEAYAANGVAPTLAQAIFAIHQMLMQFGIAGTAYTVRKLDDVTTAFTVTLDSASAPTDAKRV